MNKPHDLPKSEQSSVVAVDLLQSTAPKITEAPKRKGLFTWGKIFVYIFTIFTFTGSFFTYKAFSSINTIIEPAVATPLIDQLGFLVSNDSKPLKGQENGRINFLLLGMGGKNHPGGLLTDTIMVASLDTESKALALINIPRDLVYDFGAPNYYRKINNGFALGEQQKYPGGGGAYMSEVVAEVIGQPVHYTLSMDFEGFRRIVDDLGGIDVHVDNGFTDYQYPDYNYGWQTVRFEQGLRHLNGEKALQYSRSRHGNNGEGSDFKRSQRQKKVILATKDKLFSLHTVLNPTIVTKLLDSVSNHVRTSMEYWEIITLAQLAQGIDFSQTRQLSIDNSAGGPLHSEVGDGGAYILVPNPGLSDYSEIQLLVNNVFSTQSPAVATQPQTENPTIHVLNGTSVNGLAKKTSDDILSLNYQVELVGNSPQREFEKTVIYDFTEKNPNSLVNLKKYLQANVSPVIPGWLAEQYANKDVDFVIIVGDNSSTIETTDELPASSRSNAGDVLIKEHFL